MDPTPSIHNAKTQIIAALHRSNNLLLEAPTGSGKSTQLPQILLDNGFVPEGQKLVILQPRRIAARMLATRVANERQVQLGETVGYQVRFSRQSSAATRIEYLTEGILFQRLLATKTIADTGTLILDEFHERNIYSDLCLALAKIAQKSRPDLRIIITSASIEGLEMRDYLPNCETLKIEGRQWPIEINYSAAPQRVKSQTVWDLSAHHIKRAYNEHTEGHILVFLPGAHEIRKTEACLRNDSHFKSCEILPLHGSLSAHAQDKALSTTHKRKIILATNIAETSLTIDGVRVVIDSGLARIHRYDPQRGINMLHTEPISQASALQRAGRAGRTAPGACIRMWGEKEHAHRAPSLTPEIHRIDLAPFLLQLYCHNKNDIEWHTAPKEKQIAEAQQLLQNLGALNASLEPTATGRTIAKLPVHPRSAKLLLEGSHRGILRMCCIAAAIIEGRRIVLPLRSTKEEHARNEILHTGEGSDLIPIINAVELAEGCHFRTKDCQAYGIHAAAAKEAHQHALQLEDILKSNASTPLPSENKYTAFAKCILSAYSDKVAMRNNKGTLQCLLSGGIGAEIRRDSEVRDYKYIVATKLEESRSSKGKKIILDLATGIELEWLQELFPKDVHSADEDRFDTQTRRVIRVNELRFRDLILHRGEESNASDDVAAHILASKVLSKELKLKQWTKDTDQLIHRINTIACKCPELAIAAIDEESLLAIMEQFCLGHHSYKTLKDKDPHPFLLQWLDTTQAITLDKYAPTTLCLPSRQKPFRLRYEADHRVFLSASIQELYDIKGKQLLIGNGRIPLTIEILAPNRRPVQITEDLDSFWGNAYPSIKKDLKGRYPKHQWR